MSWSKTDAEENIHLYADTQQREGGRTLRQVTVHGSGVGVAVRSASRDDDGMAGQYGGVIHRNACRMIVVITRVIMIMMRIVVPPGSRVIVAMVGGCK